MQDVYSELDSLPVERIGSHELRAALINVCRRVESIEAQLRDLDREISRVRAGTEA
jgi:hypothetical protein